MAARQPSIHITSLFEGEIVEENDFGSMRRVTADNFPFTKEDPLIVPRRNPLDAKAVGEWPRYAPSRSAARRPLTYAPSA